MPRGLAQFCQLFAGDSLSFGGCLAHLGQPHTYLLRCDQAGVTILSCLEELLAEGVGFEPTVGLLLRLISSQVPSTTQPPFRYALFYWLYSSFGNLKICVFYTGVLYYSHESRFIR